MNWQLRNADVRAQRATVIADLVVAASGLLISLYAISLGRGNALMWVWAVVFVIFGAWQAWALWGQRAR